MNYLKYFTQSLSKEYLPTFGYLVTDGHVQSQNQTHC